MFLISILRQMNEADRMAGRCRAFLKAFLGVTVVVPQTAVPISPEHLRQCKESFEQLTDSLREDADAESIEEIGKVVIKQIEEIARSNRAAVDDFDSTMKDVVSTVAAAISGFKGHGERHESSLTKLADGFDALSRVEDVNELRRRLREDVIKLRQSVEEMRRESVESANQFEARISVFQQRLEAARKGSDIDRLTLLGSRRVAERYLQQIPKHRGPTCVLRFDVEGFRKINAQHGQPFGDKLLQALANLLRESFPEEGTLFRWGPDEFLAIAEGSLTGILARCRSISKRFANSNLVTVEQDRLERVAATVSWGAVQYSPGESIDGLCQRARENLEQNRRNG